jgi:hypothetical protein
MEYIHSHNISWIETACAPLSGSASPFFSAPHARASRQVASYDILFPPLVVRLFQRRILMQVVLLSLLVLLLLNVQSHSYFVRHILQATRDPSHPTV